LFAFECTPDRGVVSKVLGILSVVCRGHFICNMAEQEPDVRTCGWCKEIYTEDDGFDCNCGEFYCDTCTSDHGGQCVECQRNGVCPFCNPHVSPYCDMGDPVCDDCFAAYERNYASWIVAKADDGDTVPEAR
jgi:hypothetical protein